MRKIVVAAVVAFGLAGCATQILSSYVGKDVTEVAMDYGPPSGVMDLPDGSRAFMWNRTQTMMMPSTTNVNAVQSGNWVTGSATTYGGGISTSQCTYTLIGKRNAQGSYTITDYRKPSLACE